MTDDSKSADTIKSEYCALIKKTIKDNNLYYWLDDYRWLTGHLGNPRSCVWFIAEYPSRTAIEKADKRERDKPEPEQDLSENLQWNYHDKATRMLRNALTKAGLKSGDLCVNSGWNCYLTNVIKEPQRPSTRDDQRTEERMHEEARIWRPALQHQINNGKPAVLVPIGKRSKTLLKYMQLETFAKLDEPIEQYTYVMHKPQGKVPPGDPARIVAYEKKILEIAQRCSRHAAPNPR